MKTTSKIMVLLAAISFIGFTSCEKNGENQNIETQNKAFSFSTVGNYWVYNYDTLPGGEGKYYGTDTLTLVSQNTSSSNYELSSTMFGQSFEYYDNGTEYGYLKEGQKVVLCKATSMPNDVYTYFIDGDTSMPFEVRVIATNMPVNVPAGSFSCYKVEEWFGNDHRRTWYIDQNFGLIKEISEGNWEATLIEMNF